jgi:type IV pilus assembly protein PilB
VLGLKDKVSENVKFSRGKGCPACNNSGYKGRVGIYEVLKNSSQIQGLVLNKGSADDIRRVAIKEGMRTLRDTAIEKMLAGVTTVEEVVRVTQELLGG